MSVTSGTKSESGLGETIRVVIHALLIALVIRTFLFQPFNIPSGSMIPTLRIGDYLFVNKLSYGYGPYSFNFPLNVLGPTLRTGRGAEVGHRQPTADPRPVPLQPRRSVRSARASR